MENGTIRVTYSILCSHPLCYLGVEPDGTIDFIPDGNGGFKTSGSVERFPNLEAYHWNNGELQATLFQHQFFPANEIASGTASLGTSSGMVGTHSFGHGQRHMWNIPPVPTITLPQGGGGGSWNWGNPLFY